MRKDKICGFLDQEGNFHKTLHACNNANIWSQMEKIKRQIDFLVRGYSQAFGKDFDRKTIERYGFSGLLEKMLTQLFTYKHKSLVKLSYDIKRLQEEWDELEKLSATPRVLRKDWWLRDTITF